MARFTNKTIWYGIAGGLGGVASWAGILFVPTVLMNGLLTEALLGACAGMFIGACIWSHEPLQSRQFTLAVKRAMLGGLSGMIGGAIGAVLGTLLFTMLGTTIIEAGKMNPSFGITLSVTLGWTVLGAAVGLSGGLLIRSRERAWYGFFGGALGGCLGGFLFNYLSATSPISSLAGVALVGMMIGAFISLVEEACIAATLTVIKGRHIGREFSLLKNANLIGRDDRSDICLSGAEGVGMQHASITRKNGHFAVEHEEGGPAVYVNQKLVKNTRLVDGDIIRIGSVLLMFTAVKKAAVAAILVLSVMLFAPGNMVAASEPASVQITQFDVSNFPVVRAFVSVLDSAGNPVNGLSKDSISIQENSRSISIDHIQTIGEKGKHEPLSLAIVIDRSKSMQGEKIARAKEAVLRFISLLEPGDRASLLVFGDEVSMLEPLTENQARLRASLLEIKADGHTALFDAIAQGAESLQTISGRKAVIVLTDGMANRGALSMEQAIASAVNQYTSVYVVGLGNDVRASRLERIAHETGGSYFFTPSADGLAGVYNTIANRIRNEYVITFHTDRKADYVRSVQVLLKTGTTGMRAYFQPESSLFGVGGQPGAWSFGISLVSLVLLLMMSFKAVNRNYEEAHLTVVRGKGTKKEIDLRSTVIIGSDTQNDLGLRDHAVEPQHAEILKNNGHYILQDKGSSTGTFVNKTKVLGTHVLEDGDVINVGQATIVFQDPRTVLNPERICSGCGKILRTGVKFCTSCGVKAA
ncbi:MAG: VWA domain-containing protein [Nitrospirota bacterium]